MGNRKPFSICRKQNIMEQCNVYKKQDNASTFLTLSAFHIDLWVFYFSSLYVIFSISKMFKYSSPLSISPLSRIVDYSTS